MKQPKKLYKNIDYTNESALPEVDAELSGFISIHHEGIYTEEAHDNLKGLGGIAVGDTVVLNDEDGLDEKQFSESLEKSGSSKSSLSSILKKILN